MIPFSTRPLANRNHPATRESHLQKELQNLPVLSLELYILRQNSVDELIEADALE